MAGARHLAGWPGMTGRTMSDALPIEETADLHPFNLPPDDEDGSQDPDDWGED